MPNINTAYQWAIDTCNKPNVGYSQSLRNEITLDGITYYDCSSFIWFSLIAGGFDCVSANGGNTWAFTTDTMAGVLQTLGFQRFEVTTEWKKGDILIRDGHTEMVYNGYVTMGAHTDSYELDEQVSISNYTSSPESWSELWRYGNGATGTTYNWIIGTDSEYFGSPTELFDDSRKANNACCVLQYFYAKGWTVQAISALCGNIQQECTFNPALREQGLSYPNDGLGTGLVQWTPSENRYSDPNPLRLLFNALGYDFDNEYSDGEKQCDCIYAEFEEATGRANRGIEKQWYSTTTYPMSWEEWSTSTEDSGYLALVFQANYERPAELHTERQEYARQWYNYLKDIDPTGGTGEKKRKGLSKLLLWSVALDRF